MPNISRDHIYIHAESCSSFHLRATATPSSVEMLKKRRLRRESRQGDFSLEKPRDGHDGLVGSIDEVLSKVHALETAVKCQPELRRTLNDLNLAEAYREVVDLPGIEVAAAIEQVMVAIVKNILADEAFGYSLPSRGNTDQVYVEQLDRIVLKEKHAFTTFHNTSSVRKVAILTRVMQLIHGVLTRGIHVTIVKS